MKLAIRSVDHLALPYLPADADVLRRFWIGLGLDVWTHEIALDSYDHAGAGTRLQVGHVGNMLVSYFPVDHPRETVEQMSRFGHVAFEIYPNALSALRSHPDARGETRWGPGHDSLFIHGPYGLRVELVARGAVPAP